tara:strand:+ start:672 stop:806 length:135 start_codon:yes stop_codon:yes gene_type:complete
LKLNKEKMNEKIIKQISEQEWKEIKLLYRKVLDKKRDEEEYKRL